jgi:hypothetical protein
MRLWPYYTNTCCKYTHGSFNIDNEIFIIIKIILYNISFVKIIVVGPKNQSWYPKLNVPCFWNNYIIYNINTRPKSAPLQRGRHSVLSPAKCPHNFVIGSKLGGGFRAPWELLFIFIAKNKTKRVGQAMLDPTNQQPRNHI